MSASMHRPLTTLTGTTATDTLEGFWTACNGSTAGGWTVTRETDGGVTVAVIFSKVFGLWTRVVWVCGKSGVATAPGKLNLSTATASRVYLGSGKILTANYAWQGWLNAAPIGVGGDAAVHALVDPSASNSTRVEAWVADLGAAFRVEGSTTATSRLGIAGALAKPIPSSNRPVDAPVADADGRYTAIHVLGTGTMGEFFTTDQPVATNGCFGAHGNGNGNAHFGIFDGSTYVPVVTRCPSHVAPAPGAELVLAERIHLKRQSDSQPVALLCNIVGNVTANATGAAPGGIFNAGYLRRNSGASGQALVFAAVEQWTS